MYSVSKSVSLTPALAAHIVKAKLGNYTQQALDAVAQQLGYDNFQAVPPMIKNAIYLMLALVVVGSLASAGFGAIFTTNTSGWSASTVSVYYIIPIAAAIAIALYFFNELR